jgi:hypothetical protein
MLNLAGRLYNFGPVVYAVLDDLEHRRRSFAAEGAPAALRQAAAEKLAQIRAAYEERGGSRLYWRAVEREVLQNALPQYLPAAIEKTRLESTGYGLWRGGDLLARVTLALGALAVGGLVVAAPFIPIFENTFAFALAALAFFYADLRRATAAWRHSRLMNRLITEAEAYQRKQLRYMTEETLEAELDLGLQLETPSGPGSPLPASAAPRRAPARERQRS